MADSRIIYFYPGSTGQLDLAMGLRAWSMHAGNFEDPGIDILLPFNQDRFSEPESIEYISFDTLSIDTIEKYTSTHDIRVYLNAEWFTIPISVSSYHHARPAIMLWSFDSTLWGEMSDGGFEEADAGLLAFARAAGAAYILSTIGLDYQVVKNRFMNDGERHMFVLPKDPKHAHRIEWIDVCHDLGGTIPTGFVEVERIIKSSGYTRHMLAGTDAEIW
jgi:hypothetical protein